MSLRGTEAASEVWRAATKQSQGGGVIYKREIASHSLAMTRADIAVIAARSPEPAEVRRSNSRTEI